MSTRNPQNKRSQEKMQGNLSGMARKSASSAKPARPAAGSVRVVSSSSKAKRAQMERGEDLSNLTKEEKKARKAEIRRQEDRVYAASDTLMQEDPAYPRLRRIWWMMVGAGITALIATWIALAIMGEKDPGFETLQMVLIVLAYAAIIGAFIFDFVKIRPIRNAARSEAEGMSDSRLNAVLERRAEGKKSKKK